jgi:hypothetical protein
MAMASGDEQMLPPTDPNSSDAPCAAGGNGVLIMHSNGQNGKSAINCNINFIANPITGNVSVLSGTTTSGNITTSGDVKAAGDVKAESYVQIGSTTQQCASSLAGAIRYNSSASQFEGCNGTAWEPLGGGTMHAYVASVTSVTDVLGNQLSASATCNGSDVVLFCGVSGVASPAFAQSATADPNGPAPTVSTFNAAPFSGSSCGISGPGGLTVICGGVN